MDEMQGRRDCVAELHALAVAFPVLANTGWESSLERRMGELADLLLSDPVRHSWGKREVPF